MRSWLRRMLPGFVVRAYHRRVRSKEALRNASRTPQEVFSEIYREKKWGERGRFCSGSGTGTSAIVEPYVACIRGFLKAFEPSKPVVVDLGCGDFSVGSQLVEDCSRYIGVDVVPDLVRHLQESAGRDGVRFLCLDIIKDDLPAGDICLLRQVLQHLSNQQIRTVLAKLGQYRTVFVTEHYPQDSDSVIPNRDKVHGSGIRLFDTSGVYLDRPPFNIPSSDLELVLEVPGHGFEGLYQSGVIRTFRLTSPGPA